MLIYVDMWRISVLIITFALLGAPAYAEVIDRVVAFIDNTAITALELEETYDKAAEALPDITRREVLETMINRFLLLREARSLRLGHEDEQELLDEYIEIKIKAFIRIPDEQIEQYYQENKSQFNRLGERDAKNSIEKLLLEKERNRQLKKHLDIIRAQSYIKIMLD